MTMKQKSIILAAFLFIVATFAANAARVDTLTVHSNAMKKNITVMVVRPNVHKKEYPTVYLLHGYGDSYGKGKANGYLENASVRNYVDWTGTIAVIPNADGSWYFDSPVDPHVRYETFVSKELVTYIDKHYPTIRRREGRAVTGLSMGGHGALYLAIRHQGTFGAAGSMSGGVDFRPFPEKWNLKNVLGEEKTHKKIWDEHTVIAQLPLLKAGALKIIVDCGTEDFFYKVNMELHEDLVRRGIPHEFTTRPGVHNWHYWQRSLRDHFFFFYDYFHAHGEE